MLCSVVGFGIVTVTLEQLTRCRGAIDYERLFDKVRNVVKSETVKNTGISEALITLHQLSCVADTCQVSHSLDISATRSCRLHIPAGIPKQPRPRPVRYTWVGWNHSRFNVWGRTVVNLKTPTADIAGS